jgi:hypothetical protein
MNGNVCLFSKAERLFQKDEFLRLGWFLIDSWDSVDLWYFIRNGRVTVKQKMKAERKGESSI